LRFNLSNTGIVTASMQQIVYQVLMIMNVQPNYKKTMNFNAQLLNSRIFQKMVQKNALTVTRQLKVKIRIA
jgi:hypothetical protein